MSENRTQMPKTQVFEKGVYNQADVLYLPDDKGFKYLLVVVDPYDRSCDAVPLKNDIMKSPNPEIVKAFDTIYKRKYLDLPTVITMDKGVEFTQQGVKDYFLKKKVNVKYTLTGRSRQVAVVERLNQTIGSILLKRQTNQELITQETDRRWVEDIPSLIKYLNEHKKQPLNYEKLPQEPIADSYTGKLLKIGSKVRLQLDYPINAVKNNRLNGTFRSSDIRWTPNIYEITQVLLKPASPPLYLTSAGDNIARTKNQLQVVKRNEKEPDPKFLRGENNYYKVAEILDKEVVNRKTNYLCRWYGFKADEATWVPSKELDRTKDLREMKKEFNRLHP